MPFKTSLRRVAAVAAMAALTAACSAQMQGSDAQLAAFAAVSASDADMVGLEVAAAAAPDAEAAIITQDAPAAAPAAPQTPDFYGALAFSPATAQWSVVGRELSVDDAEASARARCAADDCAVLAVFEPRACAALALDAEGSAAGGHPGVGPSAPDAEAAAVEACVAAGGGACAATPAICN